MNAPAGVLLDVDGVLTVSWRPITGAPETLRWLREAGIPFRLVTNTTLVSRARLADALRRAGFDVETSELVTATVATREYIRTRRPGARCFLLGEPRVAEDLEGIDLVDEKADVVVVGGADDAFTWENLNRALRMLVEGASLVAMHRNLTWMTDEGLKLDAGAYVLGLERAAGVEAVTVGKPSLDFFGGALSLLGLPPQQVAMVGDDLESDVLAAQALGMTGVLVKTGKFRADVLSESREATEPDFVIDSVADLPELLGRTRR